MPARRRPLALAALLAPAAALPVDWRDAPAPVNSPGFAPCEALASGLRACERSTGFELASGAVFGDFRAFAAEICENERCGAWRELAVEMEQECRSQGDFAGLLAVAETFGRVCGDLEGKEGGFVKVSRRRRRRTQQDLEDGEGDLKASRRRNQEDVEGEEDDLKLLRRRRRRMQEGGETEVDGESESASEDGDSGSGSVNDTSTSHGSDSHFGTAGSTLTGYEASSATTESTPAELAMSYLYICLILALFNCSYLFFMRKTT